MLQVFRHFVSSVTILREITILLVAMLLSYIFGLLPLCLSLTEAIPPAAVANRQVSTIVEYVKI